MSKWGTCETGGWQQLRSIILGYIASRDKPPARENLRLPAAERMLDKTFPAQGYALAREWKMQLPKLQLPLQLVLSRVVVIGGPH